MTIYDDLPEPKDSFLAEEMALHVQRIASVRARMEESALTREVIAVLQDKGYVVREAEDFQATLKAERERVYAARAAKVEEGDCPCESCLREELGDDTVGDYE